MEGDNLESKETLLNVEEVVEGRVEKKEEVKGKLDRIGGLVEVKEVVDWTEE